MNHPLYNMYSIACYKSDIMKSECLYSHSRMDYAHSHFGLEKFTNLPIYEITIPPL